MSEQNDMDLMLLADGELDDSSADELRASIKDDSDAAAKIEAIGQLGETVRTYLELEADSAEDELPAFGDLWRNIERGIHANGKSEVDASSATNVDRRAASSSDAQGVFAAIARWFGEYRGHLVSGAVAAGATAVILLMVRPDTEVVERIVHAPPRPVVVAPAASLASQPPEVENLEVYEGSGMILTIPGEDGESATAVIWISSDNDTVEGPI